MILIDIKLIGFALKYFLRLLSMISIFCIQSLCAQENVLELESVIQGNQEQPKVLYIIPWQKIEGPGVVYQPMQRLIQKNFSTIDREEFQREVRYRQLSDAHVEDKKGRVASQDSSE